ncbi:MAG: hypothetical protein Q4D96_02215 [Propionibacteriaceae bacterium]|nr:hypothetical protein [Propionibacteriaceae bacterium]
MTPGTTSAYSPFAPARRPGGKPADKPRFRVLVHHKHLRDWAVLIERIGLANAQRAWEHLAMQPDQPPPIGQCTKLKGMGKFIKDGWSPVYHYEASSKARIDYQFHEAFQTAANRTPTPVVRILRMDLGSH